MPCLYALDEFVNVYYVFVTGRIMVKQPLYNRQESEYNIRVYIVDGCGSSANYIPVTFFMRRNNRPPIFQVNIICPVYNKHLKVLICNKLGKLVNFYTTVTAMVHATMYRVSAYM